MRNRETYVHPIIALTASRIPHTCTAVEPQAASKPIHKPPDRAPSRRQTELPLAPLLTHPPLSTLLSFTLQPQAAAPMSRWHGALTRDLLEIDPMEISLNAGGTWQPAAHLVLQVRDLRFQIWEAHVELREDARAERLRHRVQRRFKVGEGGETCGVASRE